MLTVLVSTISNSQIFLLKKKVSPFSKNKSVYAVFNDQSFNNTLTDNIVSFEQLGPVVQSIVSLTSSLRIISLSVFNGFNVQYFHIFC